MKLKKFSISDTKLRNILCSINEENIQYMCDNILGQYIDEKKLFKSASNYDNFIKKYKYDVCYDVLQNIMKKHAIKNIDSNNKEIVNKFIESTLNYVEASIKNEKKFNRKRITSSKTDDEFASFPKNKLESICKHQIKYFLDNENLSELEKNLDMQKGEMNNHSVVEYFENKILENVWEDVCDEMDIEEKTYPDIENYPEIKEQLLEAIYTVCDKFF